eukprot:COSAG05_NODE_1932_length_3817_cov_3.306616_1_plen_226_part_00
MLVEWVLAGEFGPFAQAAGLRIVSDMKAVGCHGLTDVNVPNGELAMDESDMSSNEEDEEEEEEEDEEEEQEEDEEEQEAEVVGDDHDEEQAAEPQEADEGNETATAPILAGYAQSLPHVLPNVSGLNWEEEPMDSESDDPYVNNVWNLTCSECQAVVSQRGAKVHLVSDSMTKMFSTDIFCSGLTFHPTGGTRDHDACQCRIRDTCAFLYPPSCISGLHLRRFRS